MVKTNNIVITLFSAGTTRLDDDAVAAVLSGDYPTRVMSKILATVRENIATASGESVVGFYPMINRSGNALPEESDPYAAESTLDHYSRLALYITPELPCQVVPDLIAVNADGFLVCREEFVSGNDVIVISDCPRDWRELEDCLARAGANTIKYISIIDYK